MADTQNPPKVPACLPYNARIPNPYGYQPSLPAGVVFVVLFGISALLHCWQTWRLRAMWQISFILGAVSECLGWIARTANHNCAYSVPLFEMQLAVLITAPAFTMMGIYLILWWLVPILGRKTLPVPPKWYLIACLLIDIVSLSVQAVGGGLAGAAFSKHTPTEPGTYTMVAGILFQLVSIVIFDHLFTWALFRGWKTIRKSRSLLKLCAATKLAVSCMVIRGVYRAIELLQGWRGYLITHERFTIALDAVLMLIALAIFNPFNPTELLKSAREEVGDSSAMLPLRSIDQNEEQRRKAPGNNMDK